MTQKLFSVWEGVYSSFSESGGDFDAFDTDIWINKQKDRINVALANYHANNTPSKDYPLPIVVAMEFPRKEKLSILDFGGGWGCNTLR